MENNANQLKQNLCKKNCGFFGNPAFDGYCSKCYKDHVKRQNSGSATGRLTPTSVANNVIQQQQQQAISNQIISNEIPSASSSSNILTEMATNEPTLATVNLNNDQSNLPNVDNLKKIDSQSNLESAEICTATLNEGTQASSNENDKKKRSRCNVDTCKRKVGLTGFDCRCGGLFCWEHRYSDKHSCPFDYKEFGQDQIRKNNPVVVGEKIQKL